MRSPPATMSKYKYSRILAVRWWFVRFRQRRQNSAWLEFRKKEELYVCIFVEAKLDDDIHFVGSIAGFTQVIQ